MSEPVTLSGSGQFSQAGGGTDFDYQWDIGDGTTISGQSATFSFDAPVYIKPKHMGYQYECICRRL